jgi:hypothetical protein
MILDDETTHEKEAEPDPDSARPLQSICLADQTWHHGLERYALPTLVR